MNLLIKEAHVLYGIFIDILNERLLKNARN